MNPIGLNITQYMNMRKITGNVTTICRCGKTFTRQKHRAGKYCSLQCLAEAKKQRVNEQNMVLFKEGKLTHRNIIKRVMLSMGVEHKCQICGLTEWLDKPISMVLDHINGRADNNRPENLRLICHNCDSQTEHYKGRNKGRGRKSLGLIK
jgi:5-methylcytosine-specific restriction endonuclease McrA